ncbi:MAG TPA: hypothetical protein VGK19_19870 [Capsulimonadaceae bacterium]
MINLMSVARLCIVLALAFCIPIDALADSPPPSPLPPASPAMLQQLGPELNFEGYGIRIPADYVPLEDPRSVTMKSQLKINRYSYTGGPHGDNVWSRYTVAVATRMTGSWTYTDLEAFVTGFVQGGSKNLAKMVLTKPEYGSLNGMKFECIHYGGGLMQGNKPIILHGFAYAFISGSKLVVIAGEDGDPYSSDSLPIMQAATSTLRRVPR